MENLPFLDIVANGHTQFFCQQCIGSTTLRIGEGPGLEIQAGKVYSNKYCFPNLHWIHGKASEVEACEFVPVQHPRKYKSTKQL